MSLHRLHDVYIWNSSQAHMKSALRLADQQSRPQIHMPPEQIR